ncbi:nuclear pore membrane glycoprotein, partial [Brachionus plicatilis]
MNLNLIILIYIGFIHNCVSSSWARLNVPKILLPIYSSKIINFTLEAKSELEPDTDDLCFAWSSSQPDIVSITPIYENRNAKFNGYDCSHRAIVSALSKHSQRMTSIIFAEDLKTNKLIRCDVIVDQIHSIRIKHTTTHLYLPEHSPESLTAEALDSESNTFTSIDGLPFEWKVFNDQTNFEDSRNVLRIAKFTDSEYEASDSIKQLESLGLHGHKILIEGLKT